MNRRMLTYVVIALIVGAALAFAVAVASTRSDATGAPGAVGEASVTGVSSDAGTEALAVADPAKEQPLLDKFTSKDPFIPLVTTSSGGGGTASPTPSPTSTSTPSSNLSAKVKVDGTAYNVMEGDKVPGGFSRRVHHHRRHLRRRDVQGHRRRAGERRQVLLRQPR